MLNILVIEDNESDYILLVRQIAKVLPDASCSRAAKRVELMEAISDKWDLIISDLHLTDIEENELLDVIAAEQHGTPCLVISGSVEQIASLEIPTNVFRCIGKGDFDALRSALTGSWR